MCMFFCGHTYPFVSHCNCACDLASPFRCLGGGNLRGSIFRKAMHGAKRKHFIAYFWNTWKQCNAIFKCLGTGHNKLLFLRSEILWKCSASIFIKGGGDCSFQMFLVRVTGFSQASLGNLTFITVNPLKIFFYLW